jgi:hypothetical protein
MSLTPAERQELVALGRGKELTADAVARIRVLNRKEANRGLIRAKTERVSLPDDGSSREQLADAAEMFATLKTLEKLETAYMRDYISEAEYANECTTLVPQARMLAALHPTLSDTAAFAALYGLNAAAALHRLAVGAPTLPSFPSDPGGRADASEPSDQWQPFPLYDSQQQLIAQEKGRELIDAQRVRLHAQLLVFQKKLEEFGQKHRAEINSNPTFRRQFQQMCSRIGVDPLSSRKGVFTKLLGFGDFYYMLGVQISQARKRRASSPHAHVYSCTRGCARACARAHRMCCAC